jgi:von Willebrand factor type A domain/Aerotolerance regulator N-terminal
MSFSERWCAPGEWNRRVFFLNLTFVQFGALLGASSAVVVALYLLDRSRRKQIVATLRFWVAAEQPTVVSARRRIQQPLSLLLQLVSICLLLLAIAQLRLGSQDSTPFDHVLILETSAWMGARPAGGPQTLMDEARARARAYLRSLPAGDRVMLVRADALAMPATAFESSREKVEEAIVGSEPGATALDMEAALEFARQTQQLSARRAGEIVFVGSGRVSEREAAALSSISMPNLRIAPIVDTAENCGLRKIGLRRSATDPDVWDIFISVRNYGLKPRTVRLVLQFGGAPAGSQSLTLPPGSEQEVLFQRRTRAAGLLDVRLIPRDAFPADDRAVIELPEQKTLSVVVYSNEPQLLRPMLEASPHVRAVFRPVAEYSASETAGLVILDRFRPPSPPKVDSIWIDPPAGGSPIPVRSTVTHAMLTRWHSERSLGEGLRSKDLNLDSATVFEAAPDDIRIAEVEAGPVIVARPGKPKTVVIGFHPARSAMRYELATPLLFANTLRWMAPDIFLRRELIGGSVGTINTTLDSEVKPSDIRVTQADGSALPFTLRNRSLHFFSGAPGIVRVTAADRELVYSLVLPEIGEAKWEPPAGVKRGIPAARRNPAAAIDLWQALACLGALGLLVDWVFYGRLGRSAARKITVRRASSDTRADYPGQPVSLPLRLRRKLSFAGRGRR